MVAQHFSRAVNHFVAEQTRRKRSRIEPMILELPLRIANLDKDIAAEERRTRITDPKHFAYSIYAKAAAVRRDNLLRTIEGLKEQTILEELPSASAGDREVAMGCGEDLGAISPALSSL